MKADLRFVIKWKKIFWFSYFWPYFGHLQKNVKNRLNSTKMKGSNILSRSTFLSWQSPSISNVKITRRTSFSRSWVALPGLCLGSPSFRSRGRHRESGMGSFRDGKFKRDFRLVPVPTPILIVRVVDHMITIMVRKLGDMLREKRKVRFDSKKKF